MSSGMQVSQSKKARQRANRQERQREAQSMGRSLPSSLPRAGGGGSRSAVVGAALGSLLGSSFGPLGSSFGGLLGSAAGRKFGQVTGLGAYHVNRNTLLAADPPIVSNTNAGVRIRHREYISDIVASQLFSSQGAFSINPGLLDSFPWLAGVAANYQQWKPWGILYEFITTSGNSVASTNTALGEVIMSTQYNSLLPPFTSKQQMLNQEFSCNAVPSENIIHPIECEPQQTSVDTMYVRTTPGGISMINGDTRFSDLGTFQIATQGQQADGGTLGSLFVTYDIELFKPTMVDQTSGDLISAAYKVAGVTPQDVIGTNIVDSYDSIGSLDIVPSVSAAYHAKSSGFQYFAIYQNWAGGQAPPGNMAGPNVSLVNCTPITPTAIVSGQGNTFNGVGVNVVTAVLSFNTYYVLDSLTYIKVTDPGLAWTYAFALSTGSLPVDTLSGKQGFTLTVCPVAEQLFL